MINIPATLEIDGVHYQYEKDGWKPVTIPTPPSTSAMNSNWWNSPATNVGYVPDGYGGYDSNKDKWKYCNHKWIDTGMVRTYCKHCDVRGNREAMTGEVTVIPDEEEKKEDKK